MAITALQLSSRVLKSSRRARVHVAILLLALPVQSAIAQRRIGHGPMSIRERGRPAAPPADTAVFGVLTVSAAASEPRYGFNFQPEYSSADSDWEAGVSVSFENDSFFSEVPFEIGVAGAAVSDSLQRHNRFRIDAMVQPLPEKTVAGIDLSLMMLGTYKHTSKAGHDEEVILEVDGTIVEDKKRRLEVVLSGMAYYDWESPTGAEARNGGTLAAATQIKLHDFRLEGEYDFRSDFLGEDSFSAKFAVILPARAGLTPSPYIAVAKHQAYSVGLILNVAEARKARRGPRLR